MKQIFIKDLKKGDSIFNESFAVKRFKKSSTRSSKPYYDLILADSTGTIRAKIWATDIPNCKEPKDGDIVLINAEIDDYLGALQAGIKSLEIATDFNEDDYIETVNKDVNELYSFVQSRIENVKNKQIKKLLESFFNDKQFTEDFKNAAAAFTLHHAYKGGLLEHSVEVIRISDGLCDSFPKVSRDLVLVGALLHDLGKMYEYKVGSVIGITKEGKLKGHIFIGAEKISKKCDELEIEENLRDEIIHLVLSHHAKKENGSPVEPKTVEAIILSSADDASFKANMAYMAIHEGNITGEFTEYHRTLGTELYKSPYSGEIKDT